MNISLVNNDTASCIVKIRIEKKDYEDQVEKQLREYRHKVHIPGFRKGMAPMGMIKKLYGKYAIAEEINKYVSENLLKYIRENNIKILGDPLPSESEQKTIDFDTQEDFEFCFDIALAPPIDIKLNKRDKLSYYKINTDDVLLEEQIGYYRQNYSSYEAAEDVEEEDLVKGHLTELDENSQLRENGMSVADAILMPKYIKGKREQAKFLRAKLHEAVLFNPFKAYKGAATEMASLLKINKERASEIKSDFRFEIQEITRYKEAELNQDFFDKVFGTNAVNSEEEFKEKVKFQLEEQLQSKSEYLFQHDMRALLIKKTSDVTLAYPILKRWLMTTNKEDTPEKIEEEFPAAVDDLKYHLIKDQLIQSYQLTVEPSDIENIARKIAKMQFAQYGMLSIPDETMEKYAKGLLQQRETINELVERAMQEKIVGQVKNLIKIETKEVSYDEFAALLA